MARKTAQPDAASVVDQLLDIPPVSEEDLRVRLHGVDPQLACARLVDRLLDGDVQTVGMRNLVSQALTVLDLGGQAERLFQVVHDASVDVRLRATALTTLTTAQPNALVRALAPLPLSEVTQLLLEPLVDLLVLIQAEPDVGGELADALEQVPPEGLAPLFADLDQARERVGTSPVLAYRHALQRPALLPLRAALLQALVRAGDTGTVALLEELRGTAADAEAKRDFQGALLRLRTRAAEGKQPVSLQGRAYVGTCDGDGAFMLLAAFQNPDGRHTAASLCIRAAGDVRGGFVDVELDAPGVQRMMEEMEEGAGAQFAQVPLGVASALAKEALERTKDLGERLPDDVRQALYLVDRVPAQPLPEVPSRRLPPRKSQLRMLREHPALDAWYLDAGDLERAGLSYPLAEEDAAAWVRRATAALGESVEAAPVRARAVGMAFHMARWHHWKGQQELALLFQSVARHAEAEFSRSALAEALLLSTLDTRGAAADPVALELSDPIMRRHLKSVFFSDVHKPRPVDLATLDFTEAALRILDHVLPRHCGDAMPWQEDLEDLAFGLASLFAQAVVEEEEPGPDSPLPERMTHRVAAHTELDTNASALVALEVAGGLSRFLDQVCADCPVACVADPAARVRDAFHAPGHPALGPFPEPPPHPR